MAHLPLTSLVVLDLTVARAGPTAVRQLADWGADVVRIESPHVASSEDHTTPDYLNLHRNKRCLALDLKSPAGRKVLHRMVPRADVVVENMRVPVKQRLGFDWPTLSALNPRVVLGSISGSGQTGPAAERGGVDQIAQGTGGLMSVTGPPEGEPFRAGAAVSDIAAGLQLAVGILVALFERHHTGEGRWVHTSLLESMIGMLDFQAARWTVAREVPARAGNHHPTLGPMGTYRTRDGHINIAAPWGRLWRSLCAVIGRADLVDDERFVDATSRRRHADALTADIENALSTGTTAHWCSRLDAAGIPCGPINDLEQTFADPQVRHLGMAAPVSHPGLGSYEVVANATTIEGVPSAVRRPSPAGGQHSDEILAEFGFSTDEIRRLRTDGIVS